MIKESDKVWVSFEDVAVMIKHGCQFVFDGPSYLAGLMLTRDQFDGADWVRIVTREGSNGPYDAIELIVDKLPPAVYTV